MQFIAITGGRPKEAAWVAVHGKVEKNVVSYEGYVLPYKIVMPAALTKTKRDYTWLFDKKFTYFTDALKSSCKTLTADDLLLRIDYAFKCAMAAVEEC